MLEEFPSPEPPPEQLHKIRDLTLAGLGTGQWPFLSHVRSLWEMMLVKRPLSRTLDPACARSPFRDRRYPYCRAFDGSERKRFVALD